MLPFRALLAASCLLAQQPAPPAGSAGPKPYKLSFRVEEFSLPDLAGRSHALLAESEGKALLLVFWSQRDPISRHYVPVLTDLHGQHADELSVYLIDSNYDELVGGNVDPLEMIRRYVKEERVTLPILIDRENRVADDFDVTANGQVFLIDANHIVRYYGGIDDDPRGEREKQGLPVQSWLADAIRSVLVGERPEYGWARSAGRPLKRAPKSAATTPPAGSSGSKH